MISENDIAAYGDLIFELSNNVQVRRGDPVRLKQFDEIERQRPRLGLSDAQIAARVGLNMEQVRHIRVLVEHRRFETDHYRRLFKLGSGRRFRKEDVVNAAEKIRSEPLVSYAPEHVKAMLTAGSWNGDTVTGWLRRWSEETPDRPAIVGQAGTLTYRETWNRADRLARALVALGLGHGDVVAIQLPNVADFLISYFAVTMIGAVLSPMHMPYRLNEMRPLLDHAQASAVICGPPLGEYQPASTFEALKADVPSLEHIIVAGPDYPGTHSLDRLIEAGPFEGIRREPAAADAAILGFTSGTASAPKAVAHSYFSLLANNRLCGPSLYEISADDVVVAGPPFTHMFGICVINLTLMAGATNLLLPAFKPADYLQTIREHGATLLFTAPAHVAAWLQAGLLEGVQFPAVRIACISGSACPPHVAEAMQRCLPNGKVTQMWGMSELFMGLNTSLEDPESVRISTVGHATPRMEVRIITAEGSVAPAGEDGELEIRGPSVISGYVGNAEATLEAFRDGWFRTGDLAAMDQEGNVRITGRVKDLINRGGVKFNPLDVEAEIDKHPKVVQSAIVPMPDSVLGEKACAFIVLEPGQQLALPELCSWLRQRGIAKMKWPERIEIIAAMPLTPTGKIAKRNLMDRL